MVRGFNLSLGGRGKGISVFEANKGYMVRPCLKKKIGEPGTCAHMQLKFKELSLPFNNNMLK